MEDMDPITGLTMVLMTIDARIGVLYNDILAELDDEKRMKASEELQNLKDISTELHQVISEIASLNPESDDTMRKIMKLIGRDVTKIRNDVDRQLMKVKAK